METPFVVLVFNDQGFGLIRWKQMLRFGQPDFFEFKNPDMVQYPESFGAKGYRIEAAEQLAPTLHTALNSNQFSINDCPVDVADNLRLTQILGSLAMPTGVQPCIR